MICGIIDLGSNTIRLSIYETDKDSAKLLLNKKVVAGLSGYVAGGVMSAKGIAKACSVLQRYRGILSNFYIQSAHVFATASLRNISNTEQALAEIRQKTAFAVDVLSGEQEARLSFFGAIRAVDIPAGLLLDIGGGSTEFTAFRGREILSAGSIPTGCLNQFYKYVSALLPTASSMRKIRNNVISELKDAGFIDVGKQKRICGVGGTIRATRKLYNEIMGLPQENTELEVAGVERLIRLFDEDQRAFYRPMLQLAPERIHTILPGMLILSTIAKSCGAEKITVSGNGVREGYLFERVLRL